MYEQKTFSLNDVFTPTTSLLEVKTTIRIVDIDVMKNVVVIGMEPNRLAIPYSIKYDRLIELIESKKLERILDPYVNLTSMPVALPAEATNRLKMMITIAGRIGAKRDILHKPSHLSKEIAYIAVEMNYSQRNIKRWVLEWLRSGRNPAAVVQNFINRNNKTIIGHQSTGKKRGIAPRKVELTSNAPAYEVQENIDKAYHSYIKRQKMPWKHAYFEMLVRLYNVPVNPRETDKNKEALLSPALIQKYRLPTMHQFRYRCRILQKKEFIQEKELPRGKRGKATDNVPGPGFFEIDETKFQIQLVSRMSPKILIGRPIVYLVVDIFSNAITGYSLTLENASWATAALALYNCFSDKGQVFERLELEFQSEDWPCRELPNMLRSDRAEYLSNQGYEFPASGTRVETPPPFSPESKGSVEGKNSETKQESKSQFDLPGEYDKYRPRGGKDGKDEAALNLFVFEKILVRIIMDLNRKAVLPEKLSPDLLQEGSRVASRIGLYTWGLQNRPGFTSKMTPNFVYEHLLSKGTGTITKEGIKFKGEKFNCDRLHELGYLQTALNGSFETMIRYNPLFAGEVFFYDNRKNQWVSARNLDQEIMRVRASFAEAEDYRATQLKHVEQAGLCHHVQRTEQTKEIKDSIKASIEEKKKSGGPNNKSKHQIRKNRSLEKAENRTLGLNGTIPSVSKQNGDAENDNIAGENGLTQEAKNPLPSRPRQAGDSHRKFKSLWSLAK